LSLTNHTDDVVGVHQQRPALPASRPRCLQLCNHRAIETLAACCRTRSAASAGNSSARPSAGSPGPQQQLEHRAARDRGVPGILVCSSVLLVSLRAADYTQQIDDYTRIGVSLRAADYTVNLILIGSRLRSDTTAGGGVTADETLVTGSSALRPLLCRGAETCPLSVVCAGLSAETSAKPVVCAGFSRLTVRSLDTVRARYAGDNAHFTNQTTPQRSDAAIRSSSRWATCTPRPGA
jgi:hypothetical protein